MPDPDQKVRILFVCMGNICRSPLAEGVFRDLVERRGWADRFVIDSAGTGSWHVGQRPDARMRQTAGRHGISLEGQRARQFEYEDLEQFDLILVMDGTNLREVHWMDHAGTYRDRVKRFREFDPDPGDGEVPDPYYGGHNGFEQVYAIVERTSTALLDHLIKNFELE